MSTMMLMGGISPILQGLMNLWQTNQTQGKIDKNTQQAIDDYNKGLSTMGDVNIPSFKYGSYNASDPNAIDINSMFSQGQDPTQTFLKAYGSGPDWQGISSGAVAPLTGAMLNSGSVASQVGSLFSDAQIKDYLASALSDIGTGSMQSEADTGAKLISQEMASGKTLEEAQSDLTQMGYTSGIARAGQVAGAQASAEKMVNDTNLARSQASAQGLLQTNSTNAGLATSAADILAKIGSQQASQQLQASTSTADYTKDYLSYLSSLDSNRANMLLNAINTQMGVRSEKVKEISLPAQIRAGQTFLNPQTGDMFQNSYANMAQWETANKKPKTGSSFTFGVIGGGSSCLSADTLVTVKDVKHVRDAETKQLRDVVPDRDWVLCPDNKFYKVIEMDLGWPQQGDGGKFITVSSGGKSITLTSDHVLDGMEASVYVPGWDLKVDGKELLVESVERSPDVECGDLMIEGSDRYVANGFIVESMLNRIPLEKWKELKRAASAAR